jgi:hypothetical protein
MPIATAAMTVRPTFVPISVPSGAADRGAIAATGILAERP